MMNNILDPIMLSCTRIFGISINPFICSWLELSYMKICNKKEAEKGRRFICLKRKRDGFGD